MILARHIKNFQPANLLIVFLLALVVWLNAFITKDFTAIFLDDDPTAFYHWLYEALKGSHMFFIAKLLAFILVVVQFMLINGITNQYNLLGFRSYLPGLFFLLITANFPSQQNIHPLLIANTFFILAWERMIHIGEKTNALSAFFNASLFIGLATLFYPSYIYLLILLLVSAVVNRVSHPREFAMMLLGYSTVWFFYVSLYYLIYDGFPTEGLQPGITFGTEGLSSLTLKQNIFLGFAGILILLASLFMGTYVSSMKIQSRRGLKLLFVLMVLGVFMFLFTSSSIEIIYLLAIPGATLFSLFLASIKNKWLAELMWFLFLGITIANQFF